MTVRKVLVAQAAIVAVFAAVVFLVHATADSYNWIESAKLGLVALGAPTFLGFAIALWTGALNADPDQKFGFRILGPFAFLMTWVLVSMLFDAYGVSSDDFALTSLGAAWLGLGLLWMFTSAAFGRPRWLLPRGLREPDPTTKPQEGV